MAEFWQKIVCSGKWLYADHVPTGVHIVCQNYDFWYEMAKADNMLEQGEQPELNQEGLAFYFLFGQVPETRPFWVRSEGFPSIEKAKEQAQAQVPSVIEWEM